MLKGDDERIEFIPGVTSVVILGTQDVNVLEAPIVCQFNREEDEKATSIIVIPRIVSRWHAS